MLAAAEDLNMAGGLAPCVLHRDQVAQRQPVRGGSPARDPAGCPRAVEDRAPTRGPPRPPEPVSDHPCKTGVGETIGPETQQCLRLGPRSGPEDRRAVRPREPEIRPHPSLDPGVNRLRPRRLPGPPRGPGQPGRRASQTPAGSAAPRPRPAPSRATVAGRPHGHARPRSRGGHQLRQVARTAIARTGEFHPRGCSPPPSGVRLAGRCRRRNRAG